jgi:hypothetical protein
LNIGTDIELEPGDRSAPVEAFADHRLANARPAEPGVQNVATAGQPRQVVLGDDNRPVAAGQGHLQ